MRLKGDGAAVPPDWHLGKLEIVMDGDLPSRVVILRPYISPLTSFDLDELTLVPVVIRLAHDLAFVVLAEARILRHRQIAREGTADFVVGPWKEGMGIPHEG